MSCRSAGESSEVNVELLDFEGGKCCSVTLSSINVYCCLSCGKYFQGKVSSTPAFTHSITQDHHLFIHLDSAIIYQLPEGEEIQDESFQPLKELIAPTMPMDLSKSGYLGIKRIGRSDYISVILHLLLHLIPLRDYFLQANANANKGILWNEFHTLTRRMWNPWAVEIGKKSTNPIQIINAITQASQGKFDTLQRRNPIEFMQWFIHALGERELISACLKGTLTKSNNNNEKQPFLFISLPLPPEPILTSNGQNSQTRHHQVNLQMHLCKWLQERHFQVHKAPLHLLIHYPRSQDSKWKSINRCIVNFSGCQTHLQLGNLNSSSYSLVGNVFQVGTNTNDGNGDGEEMHYKVHILRPETNQWLLMDDFCVFPVDSQSLFLQECILQLWKLESPIDRKEKEKNELMIRTVENHKL